MGEIKKQSISNSMLSYFGALLGFVLIYIQPNLISSSDIGLLRLLYSFSWMTATLIPLGAGHLTMRYFPKILNSENKHNGLFSLLFLLSSIGAVLVGIILFLNKNQFSSYYKNSPEFPEHFNEAIVFAYILSLISIFTIYSSALLKTTITVFLTDVFTRIGQLILVIVYHYGFISQNNLVIGYIGIFLLQLIFLVAYLFFQNSISISINWNFFKSFDLKELAAYAGIMTLSGFASMGIKFIDQLMIGHFLNENLVGVYATCVMMCAAMEIPFNSLERIAQPKISYSWNIGDKKEVEKIYEMSSRYMFFIGSIIFCVLWASLDFIFMFLPAEYQQGKTALYIVSLSSLINLLTGVNTSVLVMSHKYFVVSALLILMMGITFVANNFLITPLGINGAALATLIGIGSFNLLKYFYILIRLKMQALSIHSFWIAICLISSLTLIHFLPQSLHPFVRAALGGVFTLSIFTLMNIRRNTIVEINKTLKRFGIIKN